MAYEVRIKRENPISMDEWIKAVNSTDGVRLSTTESTARNPKTGAVISIGVSDGDAQIRIDGEWYPCFRWFEGSVAFRAGATADAESEMGRIVRELAKKLGSRLIGDGGAEYE
jgi:hypothetical protein